MLDRQTRTLPKAGRWLIAAFAVVVICHAGTAHAAASATDLNNPGYMTTAFQAFVTKINTAINATLGPGTPYIKWAHGLLLGAFVIKLIETLARYVWGKAGIGDFAEVIASGAIITALYATFNSWSTMFFMGGIDLGRLIQAQALNDNGIMGPSLFIAQVYAGFKIQDTSWFSLGITEAIENAIFLVAEVIVTGASYFAAIWPTLVFACVKLIGPVTFFTLFHERISFIFDGWLRFFLGAVFLATIGRVVLVVICLMYEAMFDQAYTTIAGAATNPIVITTANFGAFLYILSAAILSIILLFSAGAFTARLVGGADIGIGRTVGQIAKSIALSVI